MTTVIGTPPGVTASGYRVTPPPIPTTGLLAWFDANRASDFTYSNGNDPGNPPNTYVSQWRDRSGNSNHANGSGNAGYHPKRNVTINGLPAVDYSPGYVNVKKGLLVAGLTVANLKPFTVFGVFRATASSASYTVPLFGTAQTAVIVRFGAATTALEFLATGVAAFGNTGAVLTAGVAHVVVATYSSAGFELRTDGVARTSGANSYTPGTGGGVGLGAAADVDSDSAAHHLGEAGLYDRVVSPAEIAQIESYLKTKWGVI